MLLTMEKNKNKVSLLAVDTIDDPISAMRRFTDDDKLHELAGSIKQYGLIQPLVVMRSSKGRYEVIAGHRRLIASRMIHLVSVPCIIRDVDAGDSEMLKVHENLYREDVNPVDEGNHFLVAMKKLGLSFGEMAEKIGKKEGYVKNRIAAAHFPDDVQEAIIVSGLPLTVANQLARIGDDVLRKSYVEHAIQNGITAMVARMWRQQYEADDLPQDVREAPTEPAEGRPAGIKHLATCPLCSADGESKYMRVAWCHPECLDTIRQGGDNESTAPPPEV